MKIDFKNTLQNIYFTSTRNQAVSGRIIDMLFQAKYEDVFEKNEKGVLNSKAFDRKQDKLEISEYLSIGKTEKVFIDEKGPLDSYLAAHENAAMGIKYKEYLDEIYGEGNYVFISIGTSPSLIGKALECMGVETKYLPMSGLKDENLDIETFCLLNPMENYADFLKAQDITRKRVQNSTKHFVFCDYTDTGKTLERFQYIMETNFGISGDNVHYRSLNEDLKNTDADEDAVSSYINSYLKMHDADIYSAVEHLGYFMTDAASFRKESLTKHNDTKVKYFNFYMMKILDSRRLLTGTILNRNCL